MQFSQNLMAEVNDNKYAHDYDDHKKSNIQYICGDLFNSQPPQSVLGHSCNCVGSWGGGIALQFKKLFPEAHRQYVNHCKAANSNPENLLGTCLLIQSNDYWIACLFTSVGNSSSRCGAPRSPKDIIIDATRAAMGDLLRQLHTDPYISTLHPGNEYFPIINLPQINAGLFCVPWNETEQVIQEFPYKFRVYIYP